MKSKKRRGGSIRLDKSTLYVVGPPVNPSTLDKEEDYYLDYLLKYLPWVCCFCMDHHIMSLHPLKHRYCLYAHFHNGQVREKATYLRPHSKQWSELGWEPRTSNKQPPPQHRQWELKFLEVTLGVSEAQWLAWSLWDQMTCLISRPSGLHWLCASSSDISSLGLSFLLSQMGM